MDSPAEMKALVLSNYAADVQSMSSAVKQFSTDKAVRKATINLNCDTSEIKDEVLISRILTARDSEYSGFKSRIEKLKSGHSSQERISFQEKQLSPANDA